MTPHPIHEMNGKQLMFVEVPKDAMTFQFYGGVLIVELGYIQMKSPGKFSQSRISLTPGNYRLIGLTDELMEEQCKELLDKIVLPNEPIYYKNYDDNSDIKGSTNVLQSFQSFLKSKSLTGRYCLIEVLK